ncbi:MAG: sugar ABC transporter ATP-binding protein [Planctomycetota bacterium]
MAVGGLKPDWEARAPSDRADRPTAGAAAVEVRSLDKHFGPTVALDNVSLELRAGEVHALLGENGAGKSTLSRVLAGLVMPDRGEVTVDAKRMRTGSIAASRRAGIRLVHQELALCPNLSVAENLSLHAPPKRAGRIDHRAMIERAEALLRPLEPGIDPRTPVGSLGPGYRQICQIALALAGESTDAEGAHPARVIVFDEPTSSLSIAETHRLLRIIADLRRDGLAIVYVSHHLDEVFRCCDRATVLRDGRVVATQAIADTDERTLVKQMVGRDLAPAAPRSLALASPGAVPALEVGDLRSPRGLHGVSLRVMPGEIVGVAGLVGAGRSDLLDAIFGLDRAARGSVRVNGVDCSRRGAARVRAMLRAGVGLVPEDRREQGLFPNLTVRDNLLAPRLHTLAGPLGLRRPLTERRESDRMIGAFRIKASNPSIDTPRALSGGNQQKLIISRWLAMTRTLLLLDEPTRGIDVGTKAEIHDLIRRAVDDGLGVLLVSSDMPELLALSDRLLVMAGGAIRGSFDRDDATPERILNLATGSSKS